MSGEEIIDQDPEEQLFEEVVKAFSLYDRTGDGFIPAQEIHHVLRAVGGNPTQKEITSFADNVESDPDGNKQVDVDTMFAIVKDMLEMNKGNNDQRAIEDAFRVFDNDGKNTIDMSIIGHILMSMGDNLTEEEVENLYKEIEIDADGNINYADMIAHILEQ
eukprot:TRINITY_DN1771_c0_g1_i3.p1 TRINITY_DN1771_c0_g1~~TRINITY_DN1771_c0_g1_i3.p1  ORF type:complete len:161 (+),score=52.91 TRINITY_DN1771_c0_g1_i3:16-498(+)